MKLICLGLGLLSAVHFLNGSSPRDLQPQQDRIARLKSVRNYFRHLSDVGFGSSLLTAGMTAVYETTQRVCVANTLPLSVLTLSMACAVVGRVAEEYFDNRIEKIKKS